MKNFKEETLGVLKFNGKTIKDIKWIGNEKGYIPIDEFFKKANFEYDAGYGAQEVAADIIIVGDEFIMTREEYDGSEWWKYTKPIEMPKEKLENYKLYGGMWDNLVDIHENK